MSGPGRFITLEGVDGAGKSTHLQFIADAVAAASGRRAIVTREPGGTDLAEHDAAVRKFQLRKKRSAPK